MTIQKTLEAAGIPATHKDSARRGIVRVLNKTEGNIPKEDLIRIIKIAAEALK